MASYEQAIGEICSSPYVIRGKITNEQTFLENFRSVTGADSSMTAIEDSNPDNWPISWSDVTAQYAVIEAREPMEVLRHERNQKLAECDKITLKYMSQNLPMPDEWKTYMQTLRDLPENCTPVLEASADIMAMHGKQLTSASVTWPTKPSSE